MLFIHEWITNDAMETIAALTPYENFVFALKS